MSKVSIPYRYGIYRYNYSCLKAEIADILFQFLIGMVSTWNKFHLKDQSLYSRFQFLIGMVSTPL